MKILKGIIKFIIIIWCLLVASMLVMDMFSYYELFGPKGIHILARDLKMNNAFFILYTPILISIVGFIYSLTIKDN